MFSLFPVWRFTFTVFNLNCCARCAPYTPSNVPRLFSNTKYRGEAIAATCGGARPMKRLKCMFRPRKTVRALELNVEVHELATCSVSQCIRFFWVLSSLQPRPSPSCPRRFQRFALQRALRKTRRTGFFRTYAVEAGSLMFTLN